MRFAGLTASIDARPPKLARDKRQRWLRRSLDLEMLAAVKRFHDAGVPTALVSNSWREDDYDLDDRFDVVVLSGRLGIRKPDPRIYEHAVGQLGVPARDCVYVDDLGGNLKPARALGMTTIRHVDAASTIAQLERLLWPSDPS